MLLSMLLDWSTLSRLSSPRNHRQGREPTQTMTATTMIEFRMLLGGSASGPARSASMTTVKMSIPTVVRDQMMLDEMDSGIGYVTR